MLSRGRRRPAAGAKLARLRAGAAGLQPGLPAGADEHSAVAGRFAAQPAAGGRDEPTPGVQYGGEFRHQHQLAGLQRRGAAQLLQPDARPWRAELRQPGGGRGGAGGAVPGFGAAVQRPPGQLLGRYHSRRALRPVAAVPGAGRAAGVAGRAAELQRLRVRHHSAGQRAEPADGAGGQPDRHQATGHQRRRLFRRQLGASVREPYGA